MTPAPNSAEFAAHRKRLYVMLSIVTVCFLIAASMVIGYFRSHQPWMMLVFAAAIIGGFAAQGWLIVRIVRSEKSKS